jgi:hypothetical protein
VAVVKDAAGKKDAGGAFDLNNWVWRATVPSAKKRARDPTEICNLQCNLPYLPSPKIGLVIYIILYLAGLLHATLMSPHCECSGLFSGMSWLFWVNLDRIVYTGGESQQ